MPLRKGKHQDEKKPDALFDSNGAPKLASPDEPSTPPLTASAPLNVDALMSETKKLGAEGNNALVNGESNRSVVQMKNTVDKVIEAKLNTVQQFEKEFGRTRRKGGGAGTTGWPAGYRKIWALYAVHRGRGHRGRDVCNGGGGMAMLAMAGLGLASHLLQKADINVVEARRDESRRDDGIAGVREGRHRVGKHRRGRSLAFCSPILRQFQSCSAPLLRRPAQARRASRPPKDGVRSSAWSSSSAPTWPLTRGAGAVNAVTKAASRRDKRRRFPPPRMPRRPRPMP